MAQENLLNQFKEERIKTPLFYVTSGVSEIVQNYVFGNPTSSGTLIKEIGSITFSSSGAILASSTLIASVGDLSFASGTSNAIIANSSKTFDSIALSSSGVVEDVVSYATLSYALTIQTISSGAVQEFASLNSNIGNISAQISTQTPVRATLSSQLSLENSFHGAISVLSNLAYYVGDLTVNSSTTSEVSSSQSVSIQPIQTGIIGKIDVVSAFVNDIGVISLNSQSNNVISGELVYSQDDIVLLSDSNVSLASNFEFEIGNIFSECTATIRTNSTFTENIGDISLISYVQTITPSYADFQYAIELQFDLRATISARFGKIELSSVERIIQMSESPRKMIAEFIPLSIGLSEDERIIIIEQVEE